MSFFKYVKLNMTLRWAKCAVRLMQVSIGHKQEPLLKLRTIERLKI